MIFDYFKNILCKVVFCKDASVALPETYYVGFSTTIPAADGSNITEPSSDAGYTRVRLGAFAANGDGAAYNVEEIEGGEATAPWGTLTWCVLYDGNSADSHALSAAPLQKSIQVDEGETLKLKPGNLKLYFSEAKTE